MKEYLPAIASLSRSSESALFVLFLELVKFEKTKFLPAFGIPGLVAGGRHVKLFNGFEETFTRRLRSWQADVLWVQGLIPTIL